MEKQVDWWVVPVVLQSSSSLVLLISVGQMVCSVPSLPLGSIPSIRTPDEPFLAARDAVCYSTMRAAPYR